MLSLIFAISSLFSGNVFMRDYNTICKYDGIKTTLKNCEEESGKYIFVYNVDEDDKIIFIANGESKEITNNGVTNKNFKMDNGTTAQIMSCNDWEADDCELQLGSTFTRITYTDLNIKLYFYNKK